MADNVTVSGISDDSRTVNPGDLFVARSGSQDDGSRYISAAVAAGAVAIVAERQLIGIDVPVVCVSNVKDALPLLARRFYQNPTKNLQLIGVTGTNGKTSCTTLAAQLLENTALLGTRGYGFVSAMKPAGQTTPGSLTLHRMFRELADQGA
ncbi:MAG TPA: UDP-N-acetylmuramoyl-L-alanyl-D-glutamate--2,6-diaminopimelate ligase, partial [Gammaproteobacteria bacterium]|nr:UDP-N-acetylmuramoyl-L-alanyl-D-glutamate--2,6-diaminopimelate ligase [Gammaproteobacteria bacterium]